MRQTNKQSLTKRASPEKSKRSGSVLLIELDPNALNSKRKRGKGQVSEHKDEENTKVGNEEVVAAQPCRAQ